LILNTKAIANVRKGGQFPAHSIQAQAKGKETLARQVSQVQALIKQRGHLATRIQGRARGFEKGSYANADSNYSSVIKSEIYRGLRGLCTTKLEHPFSGLNKQEFKLGLEKNIIILRLFLYKLVIGFNM